MSRHGTIWALIAWALLLGHASTTASARIELERERIGTGDEVRVIMLEDPEVAFEGSVSAAGTIPIPYLGEFQLAGLTQAGAARGLEKALCETLYQKATITIILVKKAAGKIYVYGAVNRPGVVQLPESGSLSVLQLISEVDGLTSWAAPEDAYIMRRGATEKDTRRVPVDLTRLFGVALPPAQEAPDGAGEAGESTTGETSEGQPGPKPEAGEPATQTTEKQPNHLALLAERADVQMQPDDILFVPALNGDTGQVITADVCQVIVVGEVLQAGMISFAPGEQRTVMRAIFKAGGLGKFAKSKAVRLIRYGKNNTRTEQTINVAEIVEEGFLDKDVDLVPGDMLIVPQKLVSFR